MNAEEMNGKQAIEALYEDYLLVSEKERKIEGVKQVRQRLIDCGLLNGEVVPKQAVDYDANTQRASAKFYGREFNGEMHQKLEELCIFLNAAGYRLEIVSPKPKETQFEEPVPEYFTEIAKKAKQLDLKCRCDNRREDYSVFEAFLTLYADSDVSASLVFKQVYESNC